MQILWGEDGERRVEKLTRKPKVRKEFYLLQVLYTSKEEDS